MSFKEHKDSGCAECNFVQDKETLFIFLVPRELKEKATSKPLFFGKFTMTGWTGHCGFYLFRCKSCSHVSIDYPHGYTDYGLMFLSCDNCRAKLPLEVIEEKGIYERENAHIPKAAREERIKDLEDMMADVEKKGIKIIVPGLDLETARAKQSNVWNIGLVLLAMLMFGIFFFGTSD